MAKKIKAIVLLSGGLDSVLAAKLLKEQGIEVIGISFVTPFFGSDKAKKAAKQIGIKLIEKDITREHLKILIAPPHGYGKTMNPCIDCHSLMIKKAWTEAKKIKAKFVVTGEVLGERPFSQNRQALEIVAKSSGAEGCLLRPLSAKLLKPTIPEEKGWVERERLLDIKGRSRKPQMALAKKWKIKEYPSPAGGCLLTDPGFSQRLKNLFKYKNLAFGKNLVPRSTRNKPDFTALDCQLLKYGRHFWLGNHQIIIGRNHQENLKIKDLAQKKDILMEPKDHPGPTTIIRDRRHVTCDKGILLEAAKLTLGYAHLKSGEVAYGNKRKLDKIIEI
jgi:tRNA U34 2-thiouridine synthase MnmA/TrmU